MRVGLRLTDIERAGPPTELPRKLGQVAAAADVAGL
jgi:hypothetical protein